MCDIALHADVPPDWCVVIADIKGSTKAIEAGRYKDVNMISATAITAALNAAGREDVAYIFGGDGATFLVPPALVFAVAAALHGTREMSLENFGLDMRAGIVTVAELKQQGADVRVAKTENAPGVYQAALSGEGITLAETLVKDVEKGHQYDVTSLFTVAELEEKPADFTGLECRWQPLHTRNGIDLSVIVQARKGDAVGLYAEVLAGIEKICGKVEGWKPAAEQSLNVSVNPARLAGEAKLRTAGQGTFAYYKYLLHVFMLTCVGRICFAFGLKVGDFDGKTYRAATALYNDCLKFDNALRLVMDVSREQQEALGTYLEGLMQAGKVYYGIHAAPAALMTCMVFDYAQRHFHFVDGADGGYALAAKQMKTQMKESAQGKAA
jgi:hypothetical protein